MPDKLNVPFCAKCKLKKTTPMPLSAGVNAQALVGCYELTDSEWVGGWRADDGEPAYQHNCPLIFKEYKGGLKS